MEFPFIIPTKSNSPKFKNSCLDVKLSQSKKEMKEKMVDAHLLYKCVEIWEIIG